MLTSLIRNTVTILQILLFLYLLLRFFPNLPDHPVLRVLTRIAETVNAPARRIFKALGIDRGAVDWTPLFTIFLLNIAEALLFKLIYG